MVPIPRNLYKEFVQGICARNPCKKPTALRVNCYEEFVQEELRHHHHHHQIHRSHDLAKSCDLWCAGKVTEEPRETTGVLSVKC